MSKFTITPDGRKVIFSTARKDRSKCSSICNGIYQSSKGSYCRYFGVSAGDRCRQCIENEIKKR